MRIVVGLVLAVIVGLLANWGINAQEKDFNRLQLKLVKQSRRLTEFHQGMGQVQPGDWLESHPEPGQTFAQYVSNSPVRVSASRKTLYVLPLGEFDEHQKRIVELSAEFLEIYFSCKVKTLRRLDLDKAIPENARRVHPSSGVRQIKSTYVLDEVLPKRLPRDGVALIALTTSDLYPDDRWNFVFGQASLRNRVGVWSLFRNGDAETEFTRCLERTLKTASHETGHMFSVQHCIAFDCLMCGSNNLEESDRRPIYLCPECLPKIWWATKCDPIERFEKLQEFCETNQLEKYAAFYRRCVDKLKSKR